MRRPSRALIRAGALLTGPLLATVVAACATEIPATGATSSPAPASSQPAKGEPPASVPGAHTHAIERDPGSGKVLLATHEGLFVYRDGRPVRVGASIDLMGFTVAGPGHYYASGHPGGGTDLPEPVGLIESRNGGRTWQVLSRGGQSDFHALTASADGVVGYDGIISTSRDGQSWDAAGLAVPPRSLAGSREHATVLATTEGGLMRSADGGRSWSAVAGAPLFYLVDWASGQIAVGLRPAGGLYVSGDGGSTWRATGLKVAGAQALSASGPAADLDVLAVTDEGVLASRRGAGFAPVAATG